MKKIISFILILLLLPPIFCSALITTEQSKIQDKNPIEKEIWDILYEMTNNEYITAGILGYFQRESFLQSNAVAGSCYDFYHDLSAEFTTLINDGLNDNTSYKQFLHDVQFIYGGYGLGQWSSKIYLEGLYNFIQEKEVSIADIEAQCEYTIQSIKDIHPKIWKQLEKTTSPYVAGCLIGRYYDGTSHYETIGEYAFVFYKRYSEKK